jgi:hypothetical protein
VSGQTILSAHDLDALYAGLRELGWREDLARARIELIRERCEKAQAAIDAAPAFAWLGPLAEP